MLSSEQSLFFDRAYLNDRRMDKVAHEERLLGSYALEVRDVAEHASRTKTSENLLE